MRGVGLSIVSEGLYVARPSGYASEVRPGRGEDKDLGVGARVDARAILLSTIAEVLCDTTETTYVFFTTLVRDQEVDGSNPFAPTTPKKTSLALTHLRRKRVLQYSYRIETLSRKAS